MKYRPSASAASAAALMLNFFISSAPHSSAALVGAWSLDESAGTIADSTGTHAVGKAFTGVRYASDGVTDGTYGPIVVAGSTGKSTGFGLAKGQYFEMGTDNNNPIQNIPPGSSFTVMAWINPEAANPGNNMIIGTGGASGAHNGWRLGLRSQSADGSNATVRFTGYNVSDQDSQSIQVTYGTWMHVAVTYAGGTLAYFVNGTQLTDALSLDKVVFLNDTADARLTIGARRGGASSDQCYGRLDGVRVYDAVLTASEIQAAAVESLELSAVVPPPPYKWTGIAGTEWSTVAANWNAGLWINGYDAIFDLEAGGEVTIPVSVFPHSLTVSGGGNWKFTGLNVGISGYYPVTLNGTGTVTLASTTSTSGATVVNSGTLEVLALHGLSTGSPLTVGAAGTLSGVGPFASHVAVQGTVSPGGGAVQQMRALPVTLQAGSKYIWNCAAWSGSTPGTDFDFLTAMSLALTATPQEKLTVIVTGTPADFTETARTFGIANATGGPITGFDPAAVAVSVNGFTGTGQWSLQLNGTATELQLVYAPGDGGGTPFSVWATGKGLIGENAGADADPDHDGVSNQLEYAFAGEPADSASRGWFAVFTADTTGDGSPELITTMAVQDGVTFSAAPSPSGTSTGGIIYTAQGSTSVNDFTAVVEGPLASAVLPPGWPAVPPAGYSWQSFRLAGSNSLPGKGWLRITTAQAPAVP